MPARHETAQLKLLDLCGICHAVSAELTTLAQQLKWIATLGVKKPYTDESVRSRVQSTHKGSRAGRFTEFVQRGKGEDSGVRRALK